MIKIKYIVLVLIIIIINTLTLFSQKEKIFTNDTIKNYTPLLYYDASGLLFKKAWRNSSEKIDSIEYFDINGEKIENLNPFGIFLIKNGDFYLRKMEIAIKNQFNWGNVIPQDGQGPVLLSFIINSPPLQITNVRIIHGIHKSLDEELIRATKNINLSELWFYDNVSYPVLIYMSIRF